MPRAHPCWFWRKCLWEVFVWNWRLRPGDF
jgi:hypothetical protein